MEASTVRMCRVPAGPFLFGLRNVSIDLQEFWIDRHPVTNEEFAAWRPEHRFSPHRANHPATWVRWEDALGYAASRGLTLPTVEQWEKAARGTDGRLYPWGDEYDPRRFNTYESDLRQTSAVDRYDGPGESPYGICDLAGNVWEWTLTRETEGPRAGLVIACGGSFEFGWFELQNGMASHGWFGPADGHPTVGFRCVTPTGASPPT